MGYVEQGAAVSDIDHMLHNAVGFGLTAGQIGRLRQAYHLQRGTKAEKRRAAEISAEVKRDLIAAQATTLAAEYQRTRAEGRLLLGEPGALAGELQEQPLATQFNDAGALRLSSRDGLTALRDLGKLTQAEYETGLLYRNVYELQACDLRSQLGETEGRGGFDRARYVISRLHRAQRAVLRDEIERAVQAACRGSKTTKGLREIKVLRAVAGEGLSLRSVSKGGAMQAIYLASLVRALGAAQGVIRVRWLA